MMNEFTGKWLIEEMELWDRGFVDLNGRGHFTFEPDGNGFFAFGAVDCSMCGKRKNTRVAFTFEGFDEGDMVSGRGYVNLTGENTLSGRICFHHGDESDFTAIRDK